MRGRERFMEFSSYGGEGGVGEIYDVNYSNRG